MLGGSVAGVITSLAASLSFDYFHTEPYFDLRIDKRDDVVAALLLLVLGVAVGVFASLRNGMRLDAAGPGPGAAHLEDVAAVVAAGAGLDEAWPVIRQALLDQLDLAVVPVRAGARSTEHYPALGRDGHIDSTDPPLRARRVRPAARGRRRAGRRRRATPSGGWCWCRRRTAARPDHSGGSRWPWPTSSP